MYLRILKAIDEEVVDRDVIRTQQEVERNTKIKDHIRDMCIRKPVDSWFQTVIGEGPEQRFQRCFNRVYKLKELRFLAD
ncbi:unnamed protein product [Porites lobata]|uniref:Exportin-T n=1 Tax=Porites lobata TaxID=104759 RepID=A0ABN8RYJ2_9CNID|nr:unnamed protein product [Porites lobata]